MKKINAFLLTLTALIAGTICAHRNVSAQIYNEGATLEWVIEDNPTQSLPAASFEDTGDTEWTLAEIFPEENQPIPTIPNDGISNSSRPSLGSSSSLSSSSTTNKYSTNYHSSASETTPITKTTLTNAPNAISTPISSHSKTTLTTTPKIPKAQSQKPKIVLNSARNSVPQKQVRNYLQANSANSITNKPLKTTNPFQGLKNSDLVIIRPQAVKFRTRLQSWEGLEEDISTYHIALFFRQIGVGFQLIIFVLFGMITAIIFHDFKKIRKFIFDRVEFRVPIRIKTK